MKSLMTPFQDDEEVEKLLDRVLRAQDREDLTDWELDFLESMYDTIIERATLTATQLNKLDEIESGNSGFHNFDGWSE